MTEPQDWTLVNAKGLKLRVSEYANENATWMALLVHGYGEHVGRYGHVAGALLAAGAKVVAPDHQGHGRSDGERVVIEDFEAVVDDLHAVAGRMRERSPALPLVMIGHSMGGMIALRYAQRHRSDLAALVVSGPAIGTLDSVKMLLSLDPIPDIPIDPAVLSRDPKVGEAYAGDPLVWHGPFKRATLQAMERTIEGILSGPGLGDLPTLWIHGEEDALVPLASTRPGMEKLRGARFEEKIYPGGRHESFNETNREEVLGDVIGFIRKTLG